MGGVAMSYEEDLARVRDDLNDMTSKLGIKVQIHNNTPDGQYVGTMMDPAAADSFFVTTESYDNPFDALVALSQGDIRVWEDS